MDYLDDRLKKIEERLNKIEDILFIDRSTSSSLGTQQISKTTSTQPKEILPAVFKNWFVENWIVAVGILFVMLAGGWFVSYAFSNEWIGPSGRVLTCFAAGILVYILGFIILKKNQRGGQALVIIGQ